MQNVESLSGTIERLLYHNEQNGYAVFILELRNKQTATVTGTIPNLHPGEHVTLSGTWSVHPKFGKQFTAQTCTAHQPTTVVGLKKYLASGLIKGIGPTYAEKLVARFGADVLKVIDETPSRLAEVDGIGPKRIERIVAAWEDQKEISHIMIFLQEKGISPVYAAKIYKRYKHEAIPVITENPYRLADDIWGIGFKVADEIAKNMGFEHSGIKRITSGILFTLTNIITFGHLYAELTELKEKTVELLELNKEQTAATIKMALHNLFESHRIKLITHDEKHYVTLPRNYVSEKGAAEKLRALLGHHGTHSFDLPALHLMLRTSADVITLNEDQQRGILTSLEHKVSIITGGPGTGKTTLIKKLIGVLDQEKVKYRLAAPTGRAAKRMQESTGRMAETIHRLLEFDVSTMGFTRNEHNALALDYLIIDEASMIDVSLAYSLLKAVPLTAHLLFIGDVDQLPSVGAGNVLNDMITSGVVPYIRLTTIFRQAENSMIVVNAHRVNNGEFPISSLPNARHDFLFIKESNPENIPKHLEHIVTKGLPRYGIAPDKSIILTPMNRGTAGTQRLNIEMQQLLNPGETKYHLPHAGTMFKVGDRVMQMRNNYDKNVFNGDIGTIETVDLEEKTLDVRYADKLVPYEKSELDELTLAYAISIHKSQGSEYSAIIVPIFMQHFMLLQRNLIYTAITRAKKLCIFIGEPRAIAMAIKNDKGTVRTTFLKEYLTTDLACR